MRNRKRGLRWYQARDAAWRRDSQAIVRGPDGSVEVGARCWICGDRIDYAKGLGSTDPFAYEADHYYTVDEHPELEYDVANLRPSHVKCNRRRGNGKPRKPKSVGLGKPSRCW